MSTRDEDNDEIEAARRYADGPAALPAPDELAALVAAAGRPPRLIVIDDLPQQ